MPVSPYQVMAGTVIAGALVTGIKSDLPGDVIAMVTEPVYDTATGKFLHRMPFNTAELVA